MSRVYFHSLSGEAELWGGERGWLGGLCRDVAVGFFDVVYDNERIGALCTGELPHTEYTKYPGTANLEKFWQWQKSATIALTSVASDDFMTWKGHRISSFSLVLNTACLLGNDFIKLAARIHGQCEIHAYIEGIDRAWVAGIIDRGLDRGAYRRISQMFPEKEITCTWEDVVKFLTSRDDEPVVMSYSVCESFPDPHVIGFQPLAGLPIDDLRPEWWDPADWATAANDDTRAEAIFSGAWERLPDEERWNIGMMWLRAQDTGLRIQPSDWDTFYFTHGLTLLDITAPDYAERLDKAFDITVEAPRGQ